MTKKRLEAEAIRHAMLALAAIDSRAARRLGRGEAGEGRAGAGRASTKTARTCTGQCTLPVVRDQVPESLALFDFADPSLSTGEGDDQRPVAIAVLDEQLVRDPPGGSRRRPDPRAAGDDATRVRAAYLRFLAGLRRPPSRPAPLIFSRFPETSGKSGSDRDRAAWTAFCQALYASADSDTGLN